MEGQPGEFSEESQWNFGNLLTNFHGSGKFKIPQNFPTKMIFYDIIQTELIVVPRS